MIQTIQQAVKPHDKYQIEVKLDYELLKTKQTRYQILAYIFVPQSLGITKSSYQATEFYRDVQNYIRLKTPAFILRDFNENSASPLLAIERLISTENWATDPECQEHLINNFKFLSAMLKSAIREHFNLIHQRIAEATPNSKVHLLIHNLVEEFLTESQKITNRYRTLYATFNLPNVDPQLFTAYNITDESISLLIEESAVEMYQIVETHLKKTGRGDFKQQLNERVRAETKHRKSLGYRSILKLNDENEEYAFRASVLKKYASSVLYLTTAIRREGQGLEQFLFAIAAGISMIFATVVAFYFQYEYGNFTFPFFVALVVGYMFKDRIKEVGRTLFAQYLQHNLYDRRIIIRTQDGNHKLGLLKEKVYFVHEANVPKRVLKLRNRDLLTELDNDGYGENIICYAKEVTLYNDAFKQVYANAPEITGINDIIRYDIRAFLTKMDEPLQKRTYLQDEQLQSIFCHKVYHLNLVFRYTAPYPQKSRLYTRVRLVLNRDGIKRIEHVPVQA
jgi:hypothetical protein